MTDRSLPAPAAPPRRASWCAAVLAWLAVGGAAIGRVAAQDGATRLQKLLQELAATDASAWAARQAALENEAKAREQEAKELRAQAAALQQQAAAKDAAAKDLRAEIERLQKVRALMATRSKSDSAGPADEHPEGARAAGTKAETDKAAATKPGPKDSTMVTVAAPTKGEDPVTWRGHIEDLLGEHCAGCHDQDSKKGGLDVTSFAAIREGGGSGSTLVPGAPDQSRLYRLIAHEERPYMPKDEDQLPAAAIALVRRWIEHGACEDEASARAFLAEKAKATAATQSDAVDDAAAAPWPQAWPSVELRRPERAGAIRSLARSPRAGLLALPGCQQIVLLDAELQPVGVLPSDLRQVELVGFSPDGATLFAAGGERGKLGQVEVFDLRSGRRLGHVGKERDTPLAAAVASARDLVALGGSGKWTRALRLDGTPLFECKHDDFVLALAVAADGKLLAAADRSGTVRVYATRGGRLEQTLSGHGGAVNALAFGTGTRLASAGADGTVRLWDAAAGRELWRQSAHTGEALAVAVDSGGRVASAGSDGRVRVFAPDGKPLAQSPAVGEWLYAVAFGATGDVVIAGDWRGRLHRYDAKSKQLTHTDPLGPAQ